jgi:hypothetical protein
MARFRREAQVLASLDHPNIGASTAWRIAHWCWSWLRERRSPRA